MKPGVGLNFRTFIKNWGKQRVRVHRSLYLAHLCHKVMSLYRINIYVSSLIFVSYSPHMYIGGNVALIKAIDNLQGQHIIVLEGGFNSSFITCASTSFGGE